ncbi:sigma-E processing peptidase SpoIIGA [Bacillus sp. RO2]|uniref:sigma-E processing peptidase SpoIIGA n=1 Tax=Bacillus sp. RO2 TaxID=2723913 RepID=UPI00145D8EA7|nr:sigma-E processing peptidase SpoIIGA [Bacillus sp. RO2]NMH72251.1 sigma-E processing peptidase SpoIIGA [Bacillus sp. RO2]
MTVYLDAIWLLNFGFDFLLLKITGIILKRKMATWRLMLGAFLGSLIVVLMFTPLQALVANPFVKMLFSLTIILAAYGFHRLRVFVENLIVFYVTTFSVGGGMLAVHYALQVDQRFANDSIRSLTTGLGDPISWMFVFIGFPVLLYLSKKQFHAVETRKFKYDQLANISITVEKEVISLPGLLDSGNQLLDPITKTPVMIVEVASLQAFIPPEIIQAMDSIEQTQGWPTFSEETKWVDRIRIIPYRAVGKSTSLMLAIKPDKAVIHHDGKQYETNKFLLGLTKTTLSSEGDYVCILHTKMLQGEVVEQVS